MVIIARVNFKKIKSKSETKALFRHDDEKEREQTEKHSNQHINKKLTYTNTSINNLSYNDLCEKLENRIEYLDKTTNKNKRKDRVTCLRLELPVPANLPDDKHDEWFNQVNDIFIAEYGADNVLEGVIHRDEVHDYLDLRTNNIETSRVHGHFTVIPEVEGQLNAKKLVTKGNMKKINKTIHKMTKAEYGVDFMLHSDNKDTKDKESLGTVEELKLKSLALIDENIEHAHKRLSTLNQANIKAEERKGILKEQTEGLQGKIEGLQSIQRQIEYEKEELEEKKLKFKQKQEDFQMKEDSFNAQMQVQEAELKRRYARLGMEEKLSKANALAKPVTKTTQNTSRYNLTP